VDGPLVERDWVEVQARVTWSGTVRDGAIERVCLLSEGQEASGDP